jgi:hypothetical protein
MTNDAILDEEQQNKSNLRRRDLLPIWIKIFLWIFLVFGAIVPIGLILGLKGMKFNLALYGLETLHPLSLIGLSVSFLFVLKGIVALGLWTEQKWAVNLAIIDAVIGILTCVFVMAVIPFIGHNNGIHINLRLELIPLILYLIKMRKIRTEWIEM